MEHVCVAAAAAAAAAVVSAPAALVVARPGVAQYVGLSEPAGC